MWSAVVPRLAPSRTTANLIRAAVPTLAPHVRYMSFRNQPESTDAAHSTSSTPASASSPHNSNFSPAKLFYDKLANPASRALTWDFLARSVAPKTDVVVEDKWKQKDATLVYRKPHNAYSGRSVGVFNNETAGAFGKLRRILSQNSVIQELRRAERHEKKGDKRRRLASQRWRRRFAHEVRKKVQLVNEIRARGS